jgi:ribosomal-protein-alanine N-acetyltransferase
VFRRDDDALVGVYNFSEIVRGAFQSAFLGYFAFAPLAGTGLMSEGLAAALDIAFRKLKLHRVEVNIQPTNARSLALATRLGFTREGYSRRYVKIGGRWRDHVRFAMLADDWRRLRRNQRFARKGPE